MLTTADKGRTLGKVLEKTTGEWIRIVEMSRLATEGRNPGAAPGLTWRTFQLSVLNSWLFNFCPRHTPLWERTEVTDGSSLLVVELIAC